MSRSAAHSAPCHAGHSTNGVSTWGAREQHGTKLVIPCASVLFCRSGLCWLTLTLEYKSQQHVFKNRKKNLLANAWGSHGRYTLLRSVEMVPPKGLHECKGAASCSATRVSLPPPQQHYSLAKTLPIPFQFISQADMVQACWAIKAYHQRLAPFPALAI